MKSEDFIQLRLLLGTYVTAPNHCNYLVELSSYWIHFLNLVIISVVVIQTTQV